MKPSPHTMYILDIVRTPVGSAFKSLKGFTASQLGGFSIKGLLERHPNISQGKLINQVILGNTVSAGTGQNLARQSAILAGIPAEVPAFTVNSVCGSGLQSVILASQAIACGDAEVIIAGGSESASHSPYLVPKNDKEKTREDLTDSLIHDGLTCQLSHQHMGSLAEAIAEKFHITRQAQDEFSLRSHQKACSAQDKGKFLDEIIPIGLEGGKIFKQDERPRKNIDLEKLASLPAAFKVGGTVTAGNSCVPGDGAAVMAVVSAQAVQKYKLKPKARILGYASIAVDPKMVFTAGIPAIKECLKKSNLQMKDIDLFEISEAFAVQAIVTQKELKIPEEKMNIFGGDIALGHPLGAAGARILATLLYALRDQKKKIGLAAVCLGGGGAVAVAIEKIL